jgi:hypothetical protein
VDSGRSKTFSKVVVSFREGEGLAWDICATIISVSSPSVVDLCTPALAVAHLLFNITSNSLVGFQKKNSCAQRSVKGVFHKTCSIYINTSVFKYLSSVS